MVKNEVVEKEAPPGRKSGRLATAERWIGKILLSVITLAFGSASLFKMVTDPAIANLWPLAWVVLLSMTTLTGIWGAHKAKEFILDVIRALPAVRHPFGAKDYRQILRGNLREELASGDRVEDGTAKSEPPAETGPTPTQGR